MSEMSKVEEVARALSVADGMHPEAASNDDESTPAWTLYVGMARAAIAAMRVPTPEMLEAGDGNCGDYGCGTHRMEDIFTSMIDAALKE